MASPVDDRGSDAFLRLLAEGAKGPGAKSDALESLAARQVWLATWEPRAEGFRTLINGEGEEALAVFSSEQQLMDAAGRFGWVESDGTVATHESIGADILRHAWTREYAFMVVDIASDHSLEFDREELRSVLREMDATGPFPTSRPPGPPEPETAAATSSFPPPVETISTTYSMMPSKSEKLDRLSDLPTKPHQVPRRTEPPTRPHAKPKDAPIDPRTGNRPSSRPAAKPKSDPPPKIEELVPESAQVEVAGTYGAASVVPASSRKSSKPAVKQAEPAQDGSTPASEAVPRLHSDAPTAPGARASDMAAPAPLPVPPIAPLAAEPPAVEEPAPDQSPTKRARLAAPSIGDSIELVELLLPPAETLLETLATVLRQYPEIEWASYCHVARPAGDASPAVGLRVMDTYRDNVTMIIKELCEAGRTRDIELDVLLIDGHDLLRKARERAFVFFPWKPKPFGS